MLSASKLQPNTIFRNAAKQRNRKNDCESPQEHSVQEQAEVVRILRSLVAEMQHFSISQTCLPFTEHFQLRKMKSIVLCAIAATLLLSLALVCTAEGVSGVRLGRHIGKRQEAVGRWLDQNGHKRETFANKKIPFNEHVIKQRGGRARFSRAQQLMDRRSGEYRRDEVDYNVTLLGPEYDILEYYMQFTLGTPPSPFTAQVDTGSSDLAIPSTFCKKCSNNGDLPYNPSTSSTSAAIHCSSIPEPLECPSCFKDSCEFSVTYEDGSGFYSDVYQDVFTMDKYKAFGQTFGAMTRESKDFEPKNVDGIVGFGFQALSETNAPTPMDNLFGTGLVSHNIFTMCFTDDGGMMTFGSEGYFHVNGTLQYTPIVPLSPDYPDTYWWYQLIIEDMLINEVSLNVSSDVYNDGGSIVDSGTTDFLLPTPAYEAMFTVLSSNCGNVNLVGVCGESYSGSLWGGYCFRMTEAQVQAYPPIEIRIANDVVLFVPPEHYIVNHYCGDPQYYALAMDPMEVTQTSS